MGCEGPAHDEHGDAEGSLDVMFEARVEMPRVAHPLKTVALSVVAVAFVTGGALTLLRVTPLALVCIAVIVYACSKYRRADAPRERARVSALISVHDDVLALAFAGAKLHNGRYVDQRYLIERAALQSAELDEDGTVRLQAEALLSEAWRGDELLDRRRVLSSEVVFQPDEAGRAALLEACALLGVSLDGSETLASDGEDT